MSVSPCTNLSKWDRKSTSNPQNSNNEPPKAGRPCATAVEAPQRDGPLQLCAVGVVRETGAGDGVPGDGDQLADGARAAVGAVGQEAVHKVSQAVLIITECQSEEEKVWSHYCSLVKVIYRVTIELVQNLL